MDIYMNVNEIFSDEYFAFCMSLGALGITNMMFWILYVVRGIYDNELDVMMMS